jgi:glutamate-1-semialdehyde 2,1-aminomutase
VISSYLPFNNFDVLDKIRRCGNEVAALIAEPCLEIAGQLNLFGILGIHREKCTEYGIVFILDEVKTGFRIARGGAQEYYNLRPDLATYAKAMGNGFPVAAFGGKREIMSIIGNGVAQGGTYNNNMPGIAAAYATLKLIKEQPILETIERRGRRLMDGIKSIFNKAGIPICINGYPAMFSLLSSRKSYRSAYWKTRNVTIICAW